MVTHFVARWLLGNISACGQKNTAEFPAYSWRRPGVIETGSRVELAGLVTTHSAAYPATKQHPPAGISRRAILLPFLRSQ